MQQCRLSVAMQDPVRKRKERLSRRPGPLRMFLNGKFEVPCNINLNQWDVKKALSPNFTSNLTNNVAIQSMQTKILANGGNLTPVWSEVFGHKLVSVERGRASKVSAKATHSNHTFHSKHHLHIHDLCIGLYICILSSNCIE